MAKVGFVGLGVMGAPMAGHLLRTGHDVAVWSRTPSKAEALASEGARVVPAIGDLGRDCEIVMLCVNRTEDVQQCLEGLLAGTSGSPTEPRTFVDHSTIAPKAAVEFHAWVRDAGHRFVDAPITGGSMGAQKGQLTVFLGGAVEDIERVLPVLAAYAKRAERVGGPGAGQMMKMANQIAVGGALIALCESLAFAQKAGLDVTQTHALLSGGAAGSWAFDNYGPKILAQDWSPGFSIVNQVKDFEYCLDAASDIGAAIPATVVVHELLQEMIEAGLGDATTAALYLKLLELEA